MIGLNNKRNSIIRKLGALLIILILAVYTFTVYRYGNFNIFGSPHRIIMHGFRFDNDNDIVTLTDAEKPKYEVSSIMDKLTGKRIYSMQKNFKANNGTRVFLYIKDDKYIRLQCGGGA